MYLEGKGTGRAQTFSDVIESFWLAEALTQLISFGTKRLRHLISLHSLSAAWHWESKKKIKKNSQGRLVKSQHAPRKLSGTPMRTNTRTPRWIQCFWRENGVNSQEWSGRCWQILIEVTSALTHLCPQDGVETGSREVSERSSHTHTSGFITSSDTRKPTPLELSGTEPSTEDIYRAQLMVTVRKKRLFFFLKCVCVSGVSWKQIKFY